MENRLVTENQLIARLTYSEFAQCDLSADLALVPEVAGKVRAYCQRHGLDPECWPPLELALVEGLNNAIEHGCRDVPDGRVRVRWNWTGEMLEIDILDPGQFRPAPAEAQLPDPLSERGRGTFVMSALMDSVSHQEQNGHHLLILRKQLGLAKPAENDAAAALRGMTVDLGNSYEMITALFHFGEELATARSFQDFSRGVGLRLLELVGGDEVCLRLVDSDGRLQLMSQTWTPRGSSQPEFLLPEDRSVEMQVFGASEQQTVEDCSALEPHDPLRWECGSAFVCPIVFRNAMYGVLSVVRKQTTPYFTAGETRLVGAVADFLGIARTMALSQQHRQAQERTHRELEIAAEIQQSLLPKAYPKTGKYRIFGLSQMADVVGGDYFDVLPIGEKGVLLVIADVMGKGVPAALLAMMLRTTIRAHSNLAEDPGRLLSVANSLLAVDLDHLGMFITAQVAFLSNESDELVFATAGHCPLLTFSLGADLASQRRGEGIPLGVFDEVEYESMREPIAPGDQFVFLTDGVYEAESATGEMLGMDPLLQQIPALCTGDPRSGCQRLLEYVARYSAGTLVTDDRTLLIAQRR